MADREIKTRFRLEGESEYRRAMKESADAIKVLASEQKLAAAEFEATGDAQEYAAETARILKDQIREQERAVQAAQQAVEKLKAAGVDPADKSMQQWNTRLNTAKARLLGMQTQLGKANTDLGTNKEKLDEGEGSAKGFGDALDRIGKNIDFTATITAIDNVKEKIETLARVTVDAAQKIWSAETDAGKWADDLATAASKAGIDVETYQSWQYASKFIDTETSKISASITKLEKDLGSESKEMAIAFNRLGVRTREASGKVRDATDVFWDVIDALGKIEDPTERSIHAQELLGQSWKDLNPLIEAGSKAYKELAEEGRQVAVVSEEDVEKLGKLNDAQEKMNAVWTKTKTEALAGLAPAFTEISNTLSEAGTALSNFLQSAEGQEALNNLNAAVSELLKSFLGEDNGAGTFQAIVDGAAGAIRTFNDVLNWIKDNGEIVKGIVVGLAGAWATLTISEGVLTVLQLLQHIPLSKLTAAFGGAAKNAVGSAIPEAVAGGAPAAAGAAKGAVAGGLGSAIGAAATQVLPGVAFVAGSMELGRQINNAYTEETFGGYNAALEKTDELLDTTSGKLTHLQELFKIFSEAEESDDYVEQLQAAWEKYGDELLEMFPKLKQDVHDRMDAFDWAILGAHAAEDLAQGITDAQSNVETSAADTAASAQTGADSALNNGSMEAIGYNASIGLANGIISGQDAVIAAAEAVSQSAADTMASALQIKSPSKVMARLGGFVAQGFAEGIDRGINDVERAVSRMSGAAFRAPVMAAPQGPRIAQAAAAPMGAGGAAGGAAGQNIQAVIMMDKKTVGYLVAPVVNEAIGAIIQEQRE